MHEASFDQAAWLARIRYSGPLTPTLDTLNRLIVAHSHSITYVEDGMTVRGQRRSGPVRQWPERDWAVSCA